MLKSLSVSAQYISAAENLPDLRIALAQAAEILGFFIYFIGLNKPGTQAFFEPPTLTNVKPPDFAAYAEAGWPRRDPVIAHLATTKDPFLWRTSDWANTPQGDYGVLLRGRGILGGVAVPLPQKANRFGAMSLLADNETVLTADALYAAKTLAHLAMARLRGLGNERPAPVPSPLLLSRLSDQQLEILRWVARGKTNREIAVIVSSTRRTVDYHLQEILGKLEVSSRTQAVAILAGIES